MVPSAHTLLLFCLFLILSAVSGQGATRLRVEYLESPISVDEVTPRFSFSRIHPTRGVTQQSFSITVTDLSTSKIVWDSGRVVSSSSLNIEYAGDTPLQSDWDYQWSVTWWSSLTSPPSLPVTARFSTALLYGVPPGVDWIAPAPGANLLRSEFTLTQAPLRAHLYISGQGYYKSFINGQPTDPHVMGAFTVFERRVLYDVWDVTPLLHQGCNALGVALGRGWFNQSSIKAGPLCLWAYLSVEMPGGARQYFGTSTTPSGTLTFTSTPGPVIMDEIYLGEHFDATLIQPGWDSCTFSNASAWLPAHPGPNVTAQAAFSAHTVPILPTSALTPLTVTEPKPDVFVLDFGRNIAGIGQVRVVCPFGPQTIRIDYAETLSVDGTLHQFYTYPYPLIMTSNFTCAGTGEEESYTTHFSQ